MNSTRFTERYQRFSFADIQAIVVTDGPDRTIPQILAVLASIAWGTMAFAVDLQFGKWFFAITGALLLALALLDIARGPRCRCFLHTAVSRWPLPPVSRQRIARRVLATIVPAIEAVQGALPAEQLAQITISEGTGNTAAGTAPPLEIPRPKFGAVHILFALFLLDAALFWVAFRWPQSGVGVYLVTAIFGELLLSVMALIQGRANPLKFSYVLIALAVACVAIDTVDTGRAIWAGFLASALQRAGTPVTTLVFAPPKNAAVFASSWRVAASLSGLMASLMERKRTAQP